MNPASVGTIYATFQINRGIYNGVRNHWKENSFVSDKQQIEMRVTRHEMQYSSALHFNKKSIPYLSLGGNLATSSMD